MAIKTTESSSLIDFQNTPQSTFFKVKIVGVFVVAVTIFTAVLWFESSVASRVEQIESAWVEFSRDAGSAEKVLNKITANFGFGGFIHNYKNFVLRQNPDLIPLIQKNLNDIYHGVSQYTALNITDAELKALLSLKRFIDQYQEKFKLAQRLVAEKKMPHEVDISIQVNDRPAFDAINYLTSQASKRYQNSEHKTSILLADTLRFQKTGRLILVPFALFVGVLLITILRKIVFANGKIRMSRQRLQDIFEANPDAMIIVNSDGSIAQINKQVLSLLGYSENELLGQPVEMLMPERFRKKHIMFRDFRFRKDDNRPMDSGQSFFAQKNDGTEISVDIGLNFFGEGDNRLIIVILRDITAMKIADLALRRSEDVLNKAQSLAHLGSWEWDIVDNTLKWSDETYRIFGLQYQEFDETYEELLACIHSEDKQEVVNAVNASVVRDQPFSIEHRIVQPDGEERIVHQRGDVFRNDAGEPLHMVGTVHDITARKRAEAELKLANNVFNHTDEAIIVTDTDCKILRVNHAYTVICGFNEDEVRGKRLNELQKSGHSNDEFYDELWRDFVKKGVWQGEILSRRKDGQLFPGWHNMNVVKDKHGKVIQYISIFSDITEKKRDEEHIRYLAQYDQLTGLPNRTLFNDRLQQVVSRASRTKTKVGLMFIDLDRFKNINDTLAHQAGDQLLQVVADRLSSCVRSQDTVARIGGDEFTIILEDLKQAEDAVIVAKKILSALTETVDIAGHDIVPKASVGISVFPDDGDNADVLVQNADISMYEAKKQGRNRYQFYTEEFSHYVDQKFHMEEKLRHALANNELEVYYQPQINLESREIVGAEALIRWNDPEKGLLSPDEFLPFAEEIGLIEPIGDWVLETACAQAKAWQEQGMPPIRISVNVASYQITHGHIVKSTKEALRKSELAAEFLELEITEDFVMTHLAESIEKLESIRKLGVSLAIDDFGTGYSSLSYLKQLPIDRLKIDRSFVMYMDTNKDDETIASTIIVMAKSLGLSVTAEGAECPEHIDFLEKQGCEEVQGYYFSRPVPRDEFVKLFSSSFKDDSRLIKMRQNTIIDSM